MKIRVLWFGRRGASVFDDEVETYRGRVTRRWAASDRMLKPVAGGRDHDPRRTLREEAKLIHKTLEPGWLTAVLTEDGRRCSSTEFARRIADWQDRSVPGIDFVIGSDLGLDREVVDAADLRLSLGPMTLPHQIARLVLWEQLFRATHILGGGNYHRE